MTSYKSTMVEPRAEEDGFLSRADRFAGAVTRRVAGVGVLGMLGLGILTSFDVVIMRGFFNNPVPGTNEIIQTLFAVALTATLASGVAFRETLEIDILAGKLGPKRVAWLRSLAGVLFTLVLVFLTIRLGDYALRAMQRGQSTLILQWPVWPFLFAIAALVALCVPVQILVAASALADQALPQGRRRLILRYIGVVAVAAVIVSVPYFLAELGGRSLAKQGSLIAAAMFGVLWVMILLCINLGTALAVIGFSGTLLLLGSPSAMSVFGSATSELLTSTDLAVIPLFLLMGGFATVGGMAAAIYHLAYVLLSSRRAGLAHATIAGCAGFGALTGSSVATVVTIGKAAVPEMEKRGYSAALTSGSVAAGGTLGQLIPPSTAIVLFAILTEQSIGTLYMAVLVPALLTVVLYMCTIAIWVRLRPSIAPARKQHDKNEIWQAMIGCTDAFVLFAAVLGGIFFGVFTVTEAASVGTAIAFGSAVYRGKVTRHSIWNVIGDVTRATALIYFVLIGATVFSFFLGVSGLPNAVIDGLQAWNLFPALTMTLIILAFVIMGAFMDGLTLTLVTASLSTTIVTGLGYSPIWWGVMMTVLIELGAVTPPFGVNLFVMKGVMPSARLSTFYRGVLPFVTADLIKIALLLLFPALALALPELMPR
tara:strand:+ start:9181 stop:11136 length:1956 start_codon:yes stop_codon:yes gene_type:complete